MKSRLVSGERNISVKAGLPKSDIEDDFSLSSFHHRRIQLSIFQLDARKTMRVDIAGPQLIQQQSVQIAFLRNLAESTITGSPVAFPALTAPSSAAQPGVNHCGDSG